jgi:hypothetical protein
MTAITRGGAPSLGIGLRLGEIVETSKGASIKQPSILDRVRFAKCRALMERGATSGERAAARAAATRVAAAAGLSLAEALALVDRAHAPRPGSADAPRRPQPTGPSPWTRPDPAPERAGEPKPPPEPITADEVRRQKEADEARRKRAATRAAKRPRPVDPAWEHWSAEVRAAQAARDRDWAERRQSGTTPRSSTRISE